MSDCAFSPDDLWLISASWDGTVHVHQMAGENEILKLSGHHRGPIHCCAISPAGDQIVTGGSDGNFFIWPLPGKIPAAGAVAHEGAIRACAISPDGHYLLTGGDDAVIRLWRWATSSTSPQCE